MIKLNTKEQNIFFTSDTHYHHKNIVKGVSNWEDTSRCRDFNSIEEMNQVLVERINEKVGENDILFHLGDWSFGGIEKIWEFRKQINCNNIYLILGNHDHHIDNDTILPNAFLNEEDGIIRSGKPKPEAFKLEVGAGEIFNSINSYEEIQVNGRHIILCHYAMRVWNNSHKGSYMLYGHSHGTLDDDKPVFPEPTWVGDQYFIKNSKSMDVGVDTNNFYPYSFEEIDKILSTREITFNIDHHNSKTN